jgi:hypothetical protein
MCNKCKAQFIPNSILKPINYIDRTPCPTCGNKHTQKCGFAKSGKQKYVCVDCQIRFVTGIIIRVKKPREPKLKDPMDKGYLNTKELAVEKALILSTRKIQSFDSISDVPCSSCENIQRICDSRICTQLTNWLLGRPELKLLLIPREEPIKQNAWYTFSDK